MKIDKTSLVQYKWELDENKQKWVNWFIEHSNIYIKDMVYIFRDDEWMSKKVQFLLDLIKSNKDNQAMIVPIIKRTFLACKELDIAIKSFKSDYTKINDTYLRNELLLFTNHNFSNLIFDKNLFQEFQNGIFNNKAIVCNFVNKNNINQNVISNDEINDIVCKVYYINNNIVVEILQLGKGVFKFDIIEDNNNFIVKLDKNIPQSFLSKSKEDKFAMTLWNKYGVAVLNNLIEYIIKMRNKQTILINNSSNISNPNSITTFNNFETNDDILNISKIKNNKIIYSNNYKKKKNSSHFVKPHVRKEHYRHLPNGKVIKVSSCIVHKENFTLSELNYGKIA